LSSLIDRRQLPRIATATVAIALFVMVYCRLGSLNNLANSADAQFWKRSKTKGKKRAGLPSSRTSDRVACAIRLNGLRNVNRHLYHRMKRAKSLRSPVAGNYFVLIVDGHEYCASYKRHCPKCCTRRVKTASGERIQYYHRLVNVVLLADHFVLPLDMEMQKPREGEVRCAMRLFRRVMRHYPKAFDIVSADGLYAQKPFIELVRKHHKHAVVVLKDDRRDLLQEAQRLFAQEAATSLRRSDKPQTQCQVWDKVVDARWANTRMRIRVLRSVELTYLRPQASRQREALTSEWVWATTMPAKLLSAAALIHVGHRRWDIENKCFNELATYWHIDHVYRHDPNAIAFFWMLTMIAYSLFHAFYWFNLKAPRREATSKLAIAQRITAQFFELSGDSILPDDW